MNKIAAVIIDDEFFNRKLIATLVEKINPAFVVTAEAENIREGFKVINEVKPNIVFLDIKMPDGSGFDLLRQFEVIDFEVVFITGFDQYALQAFDFNALDYVLKPIDLDKFKLTLEKVQARISAKKNNYNALKEIAEAYDPNEAIITKIPVHSEDKVFMLNVDELMYVEFKEDRTVFTKESSEKYTSHKPLSDFEFILDSLRNYVRVNKTTYININFITGYSKGSETYLTMKDKISFRVPDSKRTEILSLLEVRHSREFKN